MIIKTITKSEAEKCLNKLIETGFTLTDLNAEDLALRKNLESFFEKAEIDAGKIDSFSFDIAFAKRLFQYLEDKRNNSLREMTNDGFWRYLSLVVAPHLVRKRHGENAQYYYSKTSRIWLKCMWWLIYLSWQGTLDETCDLLLSQSKDNKDKDQPRFSTDTTVAVCERTGQDGTNVELFRTIFKYCSKAEGFQATDMRRVMKLNTVKSLVVEPSLCENGLDGYVKGIFTELGFNFK